MNFPSLFVNFQSFLIYLNYSQSWQIMILKLQMCLCKSALRPDLHGHFRIWKALGMTHISAFPNLSQAFPSIPKQSYEFLKFYLRITPFLAFLKLSQAFLSIPKPSYEFPKLSYEFLKSFCEFPKLSDQPELFPVLADNDS